MDLRGRRDELLLPGRARDRLLGPSGHPSFPTAGSLGGSKNKPRRNDHEDLPRREATIEDWPHGRQRVTARFWIESNKRGERVLRQTTGKPKASTYAPQCVILDGGDGRTYFAQSTEYGFISVMRGNMKHSEETRHPGAAGYDDLAALLA